MKKVQGKGAGINAIVRSEAAENETAAPSSDPPGVEGFELRFDDPDGARASASLAVAWRACTEFAALTGDPVAHSASRVLRVLAAAMIYRKDDTAKVAVAMGAKAAEHWREKTRPRREAYLRRLEADAIARSPDVFSALSAEQSTGSVEMSHEVAVSDLRARYVVVEEFWEAPDVARLVCRRALISLDGWEPTAEVYPAVPALTDRGMTIALHGALSRGCPELTHRGRTLAERKTHSERVVEHIACELDARREHLFERLNAAWCSDRVAASQGQAARHFKPSRREAALLMTVAAFTGLYRANGANATAARKEAESKVSKIRKENP